MICMEYPYQTTDGMAPVANAGPSHYPMGGMPAGTSAPSVSYINEVSFLAAVSPTYYGHDVLTGA